MAGPKAGDLRGMPYRDSDGVVDAVVDDGEEDDGGHGQEGQHGEGDEGHDDDEVGLNSRILSQHRCKYHKKWKEAVGGAVHISRFLTPHLDNECGTIYVMSDRYVVSPSSRWS